MKSHHVDQLVLLENEVPEEVVGKRKCKVSNLVKSPYVVTKPTKRAKRSAKASEFFNFSAC